MISEYELIWRKKAEIDYYDSRFFEPFDIADFMISYLHLDERPEECVVALYLDAGLEFISYREISHGELNTTSINPREVLKGAIISNAYSLAVAHNHPCANIEPSEADIEATKRLLDACNIMGIELVDHVIIGRDKRYFSFQDRGLLSEDNTEN